MGNAHSLTRTSGALDLFVAELGGDIIYAGRYADVLRAPLNSAHIPVQSGSARFLKTVKCRHKNGYLVVKIFIKPDPGMSLRKYHRRLKSAWRLWRITTRS